MWCSGSTCLVRIGDDVFASGIETLRDVKPLNNCRWLFFQRAPQGWQRVQTDPTGRTREPSPLVGFPDGRLFLSANPTLTALGAHGGLSRPEIVQLAARDPKAPGTTLVPTWDGRPAFSEHSYRSFAADGPNHEFILFQNIGYTHAEWSFRDRRGQWGARGRLIWPWGAEYDRPQPIRVCYPNVLLKDRAVHFCGVSDIHEPYEVFRTAKKKITGRNWDYDFRRLFYTWTPDITTGKFHPWVEIASRDKTCGWIFPGDLWLAPDGAVHVTWTERALDERLRQQFFPQEVQSHAINCAVVRNGKVVSRRTLAVAREKESNEIPSSPRFQVTPDNRLFLIYFVQGRDARGRHVAENRLLELRQDGTASPSVRVPLRHPLSHYFTATIRGGSPPSRTLELLGNRLASSGTMSYARIRIE
jgi:hypothetical protein